jgi:hypothetical protein
MDWILSQLFPVMLPKVVLEFEEPKQTPHDPFATPVTECGVTMVAYDVRRLGIERHHA